MLGALEAIRGHKSAHSLATGPVTVETGERGEMSFVCKAIKGGLHFLLLHRAPWSLHTTGAAAMEAARSVQLFKAWWTPAWSWRIHFWNSCTLRAAFIGAAHVVCKLQGARWSNRKCGHSRMAFWKSPDAYGLSVAANPRGKNLELVEVSGLGYAIQRDDVLAQRHVFASPSRLQW